MKNNQYENRIVAFIDILGFKELIRQSEQDTSKVQSIIKTMDFLKTFEHPDEWNLETIEIEEDAQKKGIHKFDIRGISACTCFSDSIVLSVLNDSNNIDYLFSTVVANLAYIGAKLLRDDGIVLRGSITVGNLLHSESNLILGQALIDAYNLENKFAKYPRIILSDKIIEKLRYPCKSNEDRFPYHQYIKRFADGMVGFHQLSYFEVLQNSSVLNLEQAQKDLDLVRRNIISGLDRTFENNCIFQKFEWLKERYNELIILDKSAKKRLYMLNEGIPGNNIHYLYTDEFYSTREENSKAMREREEEKGNKK